MPAGSIVVEKMNVALRWNFAALRESGGCSNLCVLCSDPLAQPTGGTTISQLTSDATRPIVEVAVHSICGARYHAECLSKYRKYSDETGKLCAMCGDGHSGFVRIPNIFDYASMDAVPH